MELRCKDDSVVHFEVAVAGLVLEGVPLESFPNAICEIETPKSVYVLVYVS